MLFHRGQFPAGCPCTTGLVGEGIAGLIFIAQTHRLPGKLTVLAHPHIQQVAPVVDLGHVNYALGHRDLIAMPGGGHTLQRSLYTLGPGKSDLVYLIVLMSPATSTTNGATQQK